MKVIVRARKKTQDDIIPVDKLHHADVIHDVIIRDDSISEVVINDDNDTEFLSRLHNILGEPQDDGVTYVKVPSDCISKTKAKIRNTKRQKRKYRSLIAKFSICAGFLLLAATIATIILFNYEPAPFVIDAKVPDGEYAIENAFHCAQCTENPDILECDACTTDNSIVDV
jgi:hypothetical protein